LDALELGAMDFVHKPENAFDCRGDAFKSEMLRILEALSNSKAPVIESREQQAQSNERIQKVVELVQKQPVKRQSSKLVAIASSTGGPKALQSVIPKLPHNLNAPVLIVQHMPKGFTATLADRLNTMSSISVKEAAEGDVLLPGNVYLAMGGLHMNVQKNATGVYSIHYTDEPSREGVKPCANYMYESLCV
jgi:two-component system chemotaxis response regulator CheB